jgi:hypothetical protein
LKSSFNGVLFFEREIFKQKLKALQIGYSWCVFEHQSLKKQRNAKKKSQRSLSFFNFFKKKLHLQKTKTP